MISITQKLLIVAVAAQLADTAVAQRGGRGGGGRGGGGNRPPPNNGGNGGGNRPPPNNGGNGGGNRPPPDNGNGGGNNGGRGGGGGGNNGGNGGNATNRTQIGYFGTNAYQSQSAVEKMNDLWQQTIADDSVEPQNWAATDNLFRQRMSDSFNRESDEMVGGRAKVNHSQGVVTQVIWEDLGGHSYTGLYDGGSTTAIMRMSESNFLVPEASGLTPSLAIKVLRDGMESVNHMANVSFDPTTSWNFFENDFRSRIDFFQDQCAVDTIQRKFLEETAEPQSLGLSEFSRFNTDGSSVNGFTFPFDLHFEPASDIAAKFSGSDGSTPFYQELADTLEEGDVLFRVMARDVPEDRRRFPGGSTVQHIANIKLNSATVTSNFGDARLFFQHESMRQDFNSEPTWRRFVPRLNRRNAWNRTPINAFPNNQGDAEAVIRASMAEGSCPFAWLLQ